MTNGGVDFAFECVGGADIMVCICFTIGYSKCCLLILINIDNMWCINTLFNINICVYKYGYISNSH